MSSEDSFVAATAEVVMEDSPPPQRAVGAKSVKSPSGAVRGKQSLDKVSAPQTFSFLWPSATVPKTSHVHGRLLNRASALLPSPQGPALGSSCAPSPPPMPIQPLPCAPVSPPFDEGRGRSNGHKNALQRVPAH